MNKQQLANRIWAAANKMRSKIEANEYKDYILGLIFYKFLSDTEVNYLKTQMGATDEELPSLVEDDEKRSEEETRQVMTLIGECQKSIGYFIEYKNLFSTWLKPDANFSVQVLSEALSAFERLMSKNYEEVYKGIFKTLREGLSKLGENPSSQTKALKDLISLIKDIPTDGRQDYDVLGYVYEYLISNFAASAGKKAGEFYTPHEVAMVMSEIVAEHHKNKESIEIYDPTSGSGSLLITIGKSVGKHIADINRVKYYAQELKENTYNLTRMNLVMRGILPANIITRNADTLVEDWPVYREGRDCGEPLAVDAVVSNPPYSQHWDPKDKEMDARYAQYGVAPKTKADYAFLLHELHHLKSDGILTIVLPHGVLFRGGAEGQIRANLIEKNNIDAIIGLPAGIFFGTGIPTIIMVLKKNRGNEGVLIIDASKGFVKDGKQNRLRACDVRKIADTYRERRNESGYSCEVTRETIRQNDYNLNIPRYVDSSEPPVKYDIYSTMFGSIPNNEIDDFCSYWDAFPSLKQQLFLPCSNRPYSTIIGAGLHTTIQQNAEVRNFIGAYKSAFADFRLMLRQRLIDNVETVKDMEDNDYIAADIFRRFADIPLLKKYEAYQVLADHWNEIVGDIEIIQSEGFAACRAIDEKTKMKKDKSGVEQEVADGLKGRIMPFELVQQHLLADELATLTGLCHQREANEAEITELTSVLDPEDQEVLLNDDNTKFDTKEVNKAVAEVCAECGFKGAKAKQTNQFLEFKFEEDSYEHKLQRIAKALAEATRLKKAITAAEKQLEFSTIACIEKLDMNQINLLLEQKWIEPIATAIENLSSTLIQDFADDIKDLGEKYSTTYSEIEESIAESEQNLADLIGQLTGDEFAISGLSNLIKK